jgi:hypothetical protein
MLSMYSYAAEEKSEQQEQKKTYFDPALKKYEIRLK